jgi:cytochrome b
MMTESKTKILVWDAPVRVFHWLMVLSFAGAYLTAESERWRLVHVSLGYTMGGLVAFRILWGLLGTRHARFASFVRGPAAVMRYGRALLNGTPEHHVGHNPAGAVAIVLLLLLSIAMVGTGWVIDNNVGGDGLGELHEGAANFMLAVVGVHVAGVALSSWLQRENLLRSMVTGEKEGTPDEGIRWLWRPLALVLLVAVLGFWWSQWQDAPSGAASGTGLSSEHTKSGSHDRDDD